MLGLLYFFYLIIKEIKKSNDQDESISTKNLNDDKLIIFIIIGFDIVSGVFRILGSIFMILLMIILYKIKTSNILINKYFITNLSKSKLKFFMFS